MYDDVDYLIIGAGFAGAATAYHLRRRGERSVLLVDKEIVPGVHSSGRNAAIIRTHADKPPIRPLLEAGTAALRDGHLAHYQQNGVMLVDMGDTPIRAHFPGLTGVGQWCPNDGTVDAASLLQRYLQDQQVLWGVRVLGWVHTSDGLSVRTADGDIHCKCVINAAGAWAGAMGAIPMVPMNRHLFVTPPMPAIDPTNPTVWDGPGGLYFRPESGGLLLCVCDESEASPGDYTEDPDVVDTLAKRVTKLRPELGALEIQSMWVGQRTFSPDRIPVIGFDSQETSVFHVAGLGGHGVTGSFEIGRLAAALLLGDDVPDADVYSPRRLPVCTVH
jgi:D-arginine dehydrogenase